MRLGFSLDDVRSLTMADFIAFTDVTYGEDARTSVKRATQNDIDALMG